MKTTISELSTGLGLLDDEHPDTDQDDAEGQGQQAEVASDEPAWMEKLRSAGASDDEIAEARNGFLRQRDYTQKTQSVAQLKAQYEQAMAHLQGQQQAMQQLGQGKMSKAEQDKLETLLEGIEKDTNPEAAKVFRAFAESLLGRVGQEIDSRVRPVAQAALIQEIDRRLDTLFDQEITAEFGAREAGKIKAGLIQKCKENLSRGQIGDPKLVLMSEYGTVYDELREKKRKSEQTKQKQDSKDSLEGFTTLHRSSPIEQRAGREAPNKKRELTTDDIVSMFERKMASKDGRAELVANRQRMASGRG